MSFAAVPWRDARVIACDGDVLVVDKPTGIPVHGGDERSKDDVVGRLRVWLEARGLDRYLGVHQRLDKDASGVLFFTRRRELNPAVARDMEGHGARRRYLAIVSGTALADAGLLEHRLDHGRDGVTRVVERGGRPARARYRVLERSGPRALVELVPQTGRTHQLRAQLAAAGAPIFGDRVYGGAPAPRLMLHAVELELPSLARTFTAPLPKSFERWLRPTRPGFDPDLLRDAMTRRWSLFARTEAVRLCNAGGDGLPGVVIDGYGPFAVLSLEEPSAADAIAAELLALGARGVYLKIRQRGDPRRADPEALAPRTPIAGESCPAELVVREGELQLPVRLADGLSTGLFIDQRDNRALLAASARGRRVLNLFAYTCSFSVAAAHAGAREVVSVDLSQPALERGRRAFELTGLRPERHAFVHADAIEWLRRARKRREHFDWIVLDPPSFGTRGKRATFDVASDYVAVASDALALLAPHGKLLAVTHHRKTSPAHFRKMLHEAVRLAGKSLAQMKDLHAPLDFPEGPEGPATKSVLVTLR